MDRNRVSRNDPCPCGSGKKYKHCCLPKQVAARQPRPSPTITDLHGKPKKRPEYPIGTVALYGPDDKTTTKNRRRGDHVGERRADYPVMGSDRCHDEPEDPAGDDRVLLGARGQVHRRQFGQYGLPPRGG